MEKIPDEELVAGVRRFVEMVDGPWAALILAQLCGGGRRRFTELREALPGISPHTLTRRLRQLEEAGILSREYHAEVPPRVEYAMTALGRSMRPVLEGMSNWGRDAAKANQPR